MLISCRILFLITLCFSILFITDAFIINNNDNSFKISTDFKDLSPKLSKDSKTQDAINQLSKNIESRLLLVVTTENQSNVEKAVTFLKQEFLKIPNIEISDGQFIEPLIEELKPFKYQLLSPKQRQQLQQLGDTALLEQAQRKLFRMDTSVQIIPFDEDPLGLFNDYIIYLSESGLSTNDSTQSIQKDGKTVYYQPIPLFITQGALDIDAQEILLKKITALSKVSSSQFSVDILRTGVFFFAADAAQKSQNDIKFISTVSTISIIALLLFVFRSFVVLFLPVISILTGILFAIAVNHYIYGSIHILTIVFGASLIGIIIDYSLHYFYHLKSHHHTESTITKKLHKAMLLSLATSIIGYSALNFSDLDTLKKVALFSCCGIFSAWLSVIAVGSLTNTQTLQTKDNVITRILSSINHFLALTTQKLSFVTWGLAISTVAIALYLLGLPTNDDPRLFFKPPQDLLAQEKAANRYTKGFEPGRYLIIKGSTVEEIYDNYDDFLEKITPQILPSDLFSAMQLVPSPKQQSSNYQLQNRLYRLEGITERFFSDLGIPSEESKKLQSQYTNSSEKNLTPDTFLKSIDNIPPVWIERDGEITSFILINKGVDTSIIEKASANIENITYINTLELSQQSLTQQRLSASKLLILAYLFIAALVVIFYKSLKALQILFVPVTATIGTLLVFTLFSIEITLFNIMGLFLVLGLGMDYVIFIKEMSEDNITTQIVTQSAVLLSTATTLLSFGLLSLSTIPVAQAFGTTLLIGNTINFFAALIYAQTSKKLAV